MRTNDPGGRTVYSVGLRQPVSWDCGFEPRQGHECLSVANVACCQVEEPATGRPLAQTSPIDCGVSEYDRETSTMRRPGL